MGAIHLTLERVAELRALLGDADPDLIHDTIEGETDAYELMDWLIGKLGEEEAMAEAIDARIGLLKGRKEACDGRQNRLRSALQALLHATGERSVRRPEATVALTSRKPSVAHIDESALPDRFWRQKKEVNRAEINAAIAGGEAVPGVTMGNGGESLAVRRK